MKNKAIGACRYLIRHVPDFQECLYLIFCKNGVKTFAFFVASLLEFGLFVFAYSAKVSLPILLLHHVLRMRYNLTKVSQVIIHKRDLT